MRIFVTKATIYSAIGVYHSLRNSMVPMHWANERYIVAKALQNIAVIQINVCIYRVDENCIKSDKVTTIFKAME